MKEISFYDYMAKYIEDDSPAGKLARNMRELPYMWQACSFKGGLEAYSQCHNEYKQYCKADN